MKCDTTNGQEAKRVSGFDKRETIVMLPISHKRRLRVGDAVLIWPELVMRFMGWLRPSDKMDWRGEIGLVLADAGRLHWISITIKFFLQIKPEAIVVLIGRGHCCFDWPQATHTPSCWILHSICF